MGADTPPAGTSDTAYTVNPATPLTLGGLHLANRLISAPMAGVSDRTFRRLIREAGCALAFPEMVSDKALIWGNRQTQSLATPYPGEEPYVVQLLGKDPDTMAQAARLAVDRFRAQLVDINMGCPAPKITRNGEGAALLKDHDRCGRLVEAVRRAVPVAVSVKIRLGWDENRARPLVRILADAGAAFITVHARLRSESYSTPAHWDQLAEVVAAAPVPVVGNGDVLEPADAGRLLATTGCVAAMVGRGCQGNPWLFRRTLLLAETGDPGPPPSGRDRLGLALRHLELSLADKGERSTVLEMRSHGSWYIRGLPGAAAVRSRLMRTSTTAEVRALFREYLDRLEEDPDPACPTTRDG